MSNPSRFVNPARPRSAEELLETGLYNLWYLIARAEDVTDRPVAMKRLNRNLVLWRDGSGKVNVVDDCCPHRGAPLSLGEIVDGNIACAYHGVQVTGEGIVAATPPTPDCALVGQKAVKSYPCREAAEAIWIYFGDEGHQQAPEPIFPDELTSPEWTGFLFTEEWNCSWLITLDNRTDPVHGSYLHARSFTLSSGRKDAELKIEPKANGFETFRTNQRGVNIDWHEVTIHPENSWWVRTTIPYPESFGGGSFNIVGFSTPIDRDTVLWWVYRSRKLSGWRRDMWRFLYKNRLVDRANFVASQDRVLLEKMSLEARRREYLLQTDVAVVRLRRLMLEEARRQFQAMSTSIAAE